MKAPTGPAMAAALRAVNPSTPTPMVLRADVLAAVKPHYEQLARECQRAEFLRVSRRPAFRRWRTAIAPLLARLDAEPATAIDRPVVIRPAADPLAG